nr:GGDEF domain-containing phosphodiesterase [Burkholderiaceae bacterium]
SASIGAALYPRDGQDVDTLVRKADMAMYAVKDEGRNGWRSFDAGMNKATADRWRVESALHRAIERQELVLEYQPRVDVATGEVVGAEALMRWHHEGRVVPPSAFICVAEESGLIVPLTEWAIQTVCDQLRLWRQHRLKPIPVSVNISSRHIQRADLLQPVERALGRTGIEPRWLELELTETVLMHNLDVALPLLQALKNLGLSLSIDDFGTGYSSLAYLKRLPIDTLKIDHSFVGDLDEHQSGDGAEIVAAIIAMTKSLRLRVIAEGVETTSQMRKLYEQGCYLMQGWLFARSLSAEHFMQLMAQGGANPAWRVQSSAPPRSGGGLTGGQAFASESSWRPRSASAAVWPMTHANGTYFGTLGSQPVERASADAPARERPTDHADATDSLRVRASRWTKRFKQLSPIAGLGNVVPPKKE